MNKLDILSLLTDVDETYIEEAAPRTASRKHRVIPRLLCAAASLILVVGIGIRVQSNRFSYPDLSGKFPKRQVSQEISMHRVEISSVSDSNSTLTYQSGRYISKGGKIESAYLADLLEHRTTGISRFESDTPSQIEIDIYAITGISADYAIAVNVGGEQNCHTYFNSAYFPKTLRNWENDLGISASPRFSGAVYTFPDKDGVQRTVVFSELDEARVCQSLFGSEDVLMEPAEVPSGDHLLSILVDIPAIDPEYARVYVTEDGYVYANIGDICARYSIGKEAARQLIKEVLAGDTGYELDLFPQ